MTVALDQFLCHQGVGKNPPDVMAAPFDVLALDIYNVGPDYFSQDLRSEMHPELVPFVSGQRLLSAGSHAVVTGN